jgi:quercetin dioxygenase-like cupin family protein
MRTLLIIITTLTILLSGCSSQQTEIVKENNTDTIFPKGEIIVSENFTGKAWLQMFVSNDTAYNASIGNVTFEPGARTNWHIHPGGQILLVMDGLGYYQEKGKAAQVLHKGDVVKIPPQAEHWHGAASDSGLTHIAISLNLQKGNVVWLKTVSDEEYKNIQVSDKQ